MVLSCSEMTGRGRSKIHDSELHGEEDDSIDGAPKWTNERSETVEKTRSETNTLYSYLYLAEIPKRALSRTSAELNDLGDEKASSPLSGRFCSELAKVDSSTYFLL